MKSKWITSVFAISLVFSGTSYAAETQQETKEIKEFQVSPNSPLYDSMRVLEEQWYVVVKNPVEKVVLDHIYATKRLQEAKKAIQDGEEKHILYLLSEYQRNIEKAKENIQRLERDVLNDDSFQKTLENMHKEQKELVESMVREKKMPEHMLIQLEKTKKLKETMLQTDEDTPIGKTEPAIITLQDKGKDVFTISWKDPYQHVKLDPNSYHFEVYKIVGTTHSLLENMKKQTTVDIETLEEDRTYYVKTVLVNSKGEKIGEADSNKVLIKAKKLIQPTPKPPVTTTPKPNPISTPQPIETKPPITPNPVEPKPPVTTTPKPAPIPTPQPTPTPEPIDPEPLPIHYKDHGVINYGERPKAISQSLKTKGMFQYMYKKDGTRYDSSEYRKYLLDVEKDKALLLKVYRTKEMANVCVVLYEEHFEKSLYARSKKLMVSGTYQTSDVQDQIEAFKTQLKTKLSETSCSDSLLLNPPKIEETNPVLGAYSKEWSENETYMTNEVHTIYHEKLEDLSAIMHAAYEAYEPGTVCQKIYEEYALERYNHLINAYDVLKLGTKEMDLQLLEQEVRSGANLKEAGCKIFFTGENEQGQSKNRIVFVTIDFVQVNNQERWAAGNWIKEKQTFELVPVVHYGDYSAKRLASSQGIWETDSPRISVTENGLVTGVTYDAYHKPVYVLFKYQTDQTNGLIGKRKIIVDHL